MSQQSVTQFAEQAYLDYAMYVILDRALPSVSDGLKPVQRRILYAMSELGLSATSKPKKSARTVGDVIGKFHPHGDSACYEAMVHMAQWFSYRYPLVHGQGNWGAPDDPKSFAAMRYTESRLSAYAKSLLQELGEDTVDWAPNFDGSLEEPILLPARLPNVLLNGATGIAVGMSTDIPPHNLNEVTDACIALLDKPKTSLTELLKIIKGPDFPTGGRLVACQEELLQMYQAGRSTLKLRAEYQVHKDRIDVTALPYQTSINKIYEQIADQMKAKKLPMLLDLRDESDQADPVRLVMYLRSNRVDAQAVMQHLFATTDLEKTIRVNMNMIALDGRPRVFDLRALLVEWLTFRKQTVIRRLNHRLDQVTDRLHILDGLLIAYLNIDAVIKIIRTEDKPKPVLMKKFKLTGTQAESILNLRLRRLGKLEEIEIKAEQKALNAEQAELETLLGSKARLKTLIKKELKADAALYGKDDVRRTQLIEEVAPAKALSASDVLPKEAVTVILSKRGWARVGKGHETDPMQLKYKSGDGFLHAALGYSNQPVVCFGSNGRAYTTLAHSLPSARGFGEPLSGRFNVGDGTTFVGLGMGADDQAVVVASDGGYGFVTTMGELQTKQKAGRVVLSLPKAKQERAIAPCAVHEGANWVAVLSSDGRLLTYPIEELPVQAKGRGVKLMQLPKGSDVKMVSVAVLTDEDSLVVHTEKRSMTLDVEALEAYEGARARRGLVLPRGWRTVTRIEVASTE